MTQEKERYPGNPSYEDSATTNVVGDGENGGVVEFNDDVYVYGTLYADVFGSALNVDSLTELEVGKLVVNDDAIFNSDVYIAGELDVEYLTVKQRFNVGVGGSVLTAISSAKYEDDGQIPGRVGIGTSQPDGRFQVNVGGEGLDPEMPVDPLYSAFIVTDKGGIGIGTTQPDGKFQIGDECVTVTEECRVGIGTSLPDGKVQVGVREKSFILAQDPNTGVTSVGIGTTQPYQHLQVGEKDDSFVVTETGIVGIGSTDPGNIPNYDASIDGPIKLDVEGTVKIDRNIIDSADSPGVNGYYMNQDVNGIRWIQASPLSLDGMYAQDEGVYLPNNSAAQLFTVWNYKQINSQGTGVDNLIPIPNPNNPTMICDIQTQDFWGHNGTNIYRMTKVGINNNNPYADLDITGEVHATGNVDFDSQLNVDGDTYLNAKLDVDGATTLNATLDVDGNTTLNAALDVDGGTTLNSTLDVDGLTTFNDGTDASSPTNASVQLDGGLGVVKKVHIGGKVTVDDATQSNDKDTGSIITEGGVGIEKNLNVGQNTKLIGTLELESFLIDKINKTGYDSSKTKNDWRLSAYADGVKWRPSGVETKNTFWVTKDGDDTNTGLLEGDAMATIGAAAAVAQEGDTIKVRSGVYTENNPIGLRDNVTVTGEDLRLVSVIPSNTNKDVFHVRRGCLIQNLSFHGSNGVQTEHSTKMGAVAFPPTIADINSGEFFQAVTGYTVVGPANEGSTGRYKSPYIRNCTNFMTKSIGMKINGHHVNAAYTGTNDLGQDLKSMVCDSFTQYNEAGIGVSISHNGYAQLVSIFTIGNKIAIGCTSGGQCDLTNSNSSFGIFGLVADGVGAVEFDGTTEEAIGGESDSVKLLECRDFNSPRRYRTPFDGQGAYFHLDLSTYQDVLPSYSGTVTKPLEFIRSVEVTNGGNAGEYSASAPPVVTATLPRGPEAIFAEFSPNITEDGRIESIDVIASGRNFLPVNNDASTRDNTKEQECIITISGGGSATAEANMDPILFTVDEATETPTVLPDRGKTTITFNEFIPYSVTAGTKVELVRLSRIITSSHSFEYIGAGTDINTANPFQAGKPIPENEVVAINGGQVPFTSTDQKGNFRIGDGLTIDQTTSTIRGRDFNRAIQAQLTPLILALK
jgi:hypothetical protein